MRCGRIIPGRMNHSAGMGDREPSHEEGPSFVDQDSVHRVSLPLIDGLTSQGDFVSQKTQEFVDEVSLIEKHLCHDPVPWNTAVKFLMARKFDVSRAVELYFSHQETRRRENLHHVDPLEPKLRRELLTEKFTVLTSRDESGAAIALFTAKRHRPAYTSHQDTLKGLIFQLDAALESHETQRNGLVFIYDMTDSKYRNFDYELSIKILTMLKGAYPARLKKVLIVTAPLWFKAPFKILRLFVREKLRDRVYTVNREQLVQHIIPESLPQHLGGLLQVDHREWLRHCLRTMANQVDTNSEHANCVEAFFAAANDASAPNSPSSGESDHLDAFDLDGELESEDSHETVPEKHNDEDREKEVEFEKDETSQKRIQPDMPENVPPSKRTPDPTLARGAEPVKDTSIVKSPSQKIYEESIHTPESTAMTMEDFIRYCRQKRKKRLQNDYAHIKMEAPTGTFNEAKKKINAVKNRYTDVLCFDHSRVKLDREEDEDYINANFVDGYNHKNAYINTQGPLPRTFGDFWEMVWQQQVTTIVMTTRTIERSRLKCGQYWPREESAVEYGEYIVINNGVKTTPDYVQTSLVLQNLQSGVKREITHLQFISWPDYGVPHSASAFLDFLFHVREVQADHVRALGDAWTGHPLGPPIVVHCSAGIGRTGTFCTIDISLRQLADTGTVDVERTVRRIRSQRAFSIQMPDQYIFCHVALIEHAQRTGLVQDIDLKGFDDSESESD